MFSIMMSYLMSSVWGIKNFPILVCSSLEWSLGAILLVMYFFESCSGLEEFFWGVLGLTGGLWVSMELMLILTLIDLGMYFFFFVFVGSEYLNFICISNPFSDWESVKLFCSKFCSKFNFIVWKILNLKKNEDKETSDLNSKVDQDVESFSGKLKKWGWRFVDFLLWCLSLGWKVLNFIYTYFYVLMSCLTWLWDYNIFGILFWAYLFVLMAVGLSCWISYYILKWIFQAVNWFLFNCLPSVWNFFVYWKNWVVGWYDFILIQYAVFKSSFWKWVEKWFDRWVDSWGINFFGLLFDFYDWAEVHVVKGCLVLLVGFLFFEYKSFMFQLVDWAVWFAKGLNMWGVIGLLLLYSFLEHYLYEPFVEWWCDNCDWVEALCLGYFNMVKGFVMGVYNGIIGFHHGIQNLLISIYSGIMGTLDTILWTWEEIMSNVVDKYIYNTVIYMMWASSFCVLNWGWFVDWVIWGFSLGVSVLLGVVVVYFEFSVVDGLSGFYDWFCVEWFDIGMCFWYLGMFVFIFMIVSFSMSLILECVFDAADYSFDVITNGLVVDYKRDGSEFYSVWVFFCISVFFILIFSFGFFWYSGLFFSGYSYLSFPIFGEWINSNSFYGASKVFSLLFKKILVNSPSDVKIPLFYSCNYFVIFGVFMFLMGPSLCLLFYFAYSISSGVGLSYKDEEEGK